MRGWADLGARGPGRTVESVQPGTTHPAVEAPLGPEQHGELGRAPHQSTGSIRS